MYVSLNKRSLGITYYFLIGRMSENVTHSFRKLKSSLPFPTFSNFLGFMRNYALTITHSTNVGINYLLGRLAVLYGKTGFEVNSFLFLFYSTILLLYWSII